MTIIYRIRIYHAFLAALCLLAYISEDWELVHSYLGYGVAAVVLFRLLWAFFGERQVGLTKFYPDFHGLNLSGALNHPFINKALLFGIAISVIGVTTTGIFIDKGKALGIEKASFVAAVYADDDDNKHRHDHHENEFLEEVHEFFANMMLLFASFHVTYVLLFRNPLARFMLFLPKKDLKK